MRLEELGFACLRKVAVAAFLFADYAPESLKALLAAYRLLRCASLLPLPSGERAGVRGGCSREVCYEDLPQQRALH